MILLWAGFVALILLLLALDLCVVNRKAHVVRTSEALAWTAFWIALALIFNVGVYYLYKHQLFGIGREIGHELTGQQAALQFFTGYVIEKSLSLDNIFVIALILTYFRVPPIYQHRVLYWGVLGALVMRGVMIAAGAALVRRFDWIIYVFGGLLLLTAVKMLIARHDNLEPHRNPLVKLARRLFPITGDFEGPKFFTHINGRRAATPLFLVLLVVESSDVLFAIDSIPAIFAVTRDPFLVFTSNVFAILGLRSLYFALAGLMDRFRYLKMGLVFILAYVGVKMLLSHHHPIPTVVSLAVIAGILFVSILASFLGARRDTAPLASPIPTEVSTFAEITYRTAKRIVILIVGSTVVIIGIVMLAMPGPGLATIVLGLAILAVEFTFARRWLKRVKDTGVAIKDWVSNGSDNHASDDR
ncbi:MAG: TerC/Alx family metal homeostasis membrane protein [Phycisphaerae bacterium]|nr:TerC/Alx family metal homeostasis membrane protein [Phycisphaerae bacterium]